MSVLGALAPSGRPLVVVPLFLAVTFDTARTWEDLRDLDIFGYLSPTFHQESGTTFSTIS